MNYQITSKLTAKKIADLNHLLDVLSSPDLTLSAAKVWDQRVKSLLCATPQTQASSEKCQLIAGPKQPRYACSFRDFVPVAVQSNMDEFSTR